MIIKWTNTFSGEEGYVKSISKKEGHFVDTKNVEKAKSYKDEASAKKAIDSLIAMGEGEEKCNTFSIV